MGPGLDTLCAIFGSHDFSLYALGSSCSLHVKGTLALVFHCLGKAWMDLESFPRVEGGTPSLSLPCKYPASYTRLPLLRLFSLLKAYPVVSHASCCLSFFSLTLHQASTLPIEVPTPTPLGDFDLLKGVLSVTGMPEFSKPNSGPDVCFSCADKSSHS